MENYVGHIKKGDVVYIPFPLDRLATSKADDVNIKEDNPGEKEASPKDDDPREKKDRPVVVLFRAEVDSYTVCAITKQPHREHKIELNSRDLASGRMENDPSFIRPNLLTTVKRCYIRRKAGSLKPHKVKEVTDKVKEFLDAEPEDAPVHKALERGKRRIR